MLMKKNLYCFIFIILVFILFINISCEKRNEKSLWDYSFTDVTGNIKGNKDKDTINLDIYLDATTSMQGFAVNQNSAYNKFIEELESAANITWKKTDVKYFKFGTKVKPIGRAEFLSARTPLFYKEKGIFEETKIDSVIYKTDISRLTIVVTDLFQTEADVNSIVLQIKNRCFLQDIQLGILGIQSFYDGRVYDAKVPAYNFVSKEGDEETYRPFYAIMFGEPENMIRLFSVLKNKPYVKEKNFILISKHLISRFDTRLTKSKESKELSIRKSENGPNTFEFSLRDETRRSKFDLEINYKQKENTYGFIPSKLELETFSKTILKENKNSLNNNYSHNVSLSTLVNNDNKINSVLDINIPKAPGTYSYCIYIRLPLSGGYIVPEWVMQYSSDNPNPLKDSNKTLNLEKFISDLIQANITVSKPKIAKIYLTIKD